MRIIRLAMVSILCALALFTQVQAQEDARAVWQVVRYDITASAPPTGRVLTSRAVLAIRNLGQGSGASISLRINAKAEIKSIIVNDAQARFRTSEERSGRNLQRLNITLPAPVEPDATFNIAVEYTLPVADNNGLASVSPLGTQFLPLSFWYPTPGNPYFPRGADTAPYRLTITNSGGDTLVSSGKMGGTTFEQPLNGQPFFTTGSWEIIEGAGEARGVSAWLAKGASAEERKQGKALVALAGEARSYFAKLLGEAPEVPIRLVSVPRGAGYNDGGTLLLNAASFRRGKVDSATMMLVAETVARLWIGGKTAVRGEGGGVVREGLPRYLATLFVEGKFGGDVAEAERQRQREAFAAIARRDAPLAQSTLLDDSYYTAVSNKGAMVWRLAARLLGRDAFIKVLREQLIARAVDAGGLTLSSLRAALAETGSDKLKSLFEQALDQRTDMDLIIGVPQQRGGEWVAALRNAGALDATVTVTALTESGERLKTEVTIPGRSFGEAVFKTGAKLRRVEVDPDKLYPQFDYSNDVAPRPATNDDPIAEATRAFVRQEYAKAEGLSRELLAGAQHDEEARILLARALLAQNKMDEAEREFRAALDEKLPSPTTLAWGNVGLGEISLRRGQAAAAARFFDQAVMDDGEYASTLAARAGRIKAEAAANAAPVPDESVRNFIAQLDKVIVSGQSASVGAMIVPGELERFVKGLVGSQPEIWQTRVVRTEQLDATRMAVDVALNVKQLGGEQAGTAVYILARMGGGWKLYGIEFFEVR